MRVGGCKRKSNITYTAFKKIELKDEDVTINRVAYFRI